MLTQKPLLYYTRHPGWFEVETLGCRWHACRVVTLPFLIYMSSRVPGRVAAAFSERARMHIRREPG